MLAAYDKKTVIANVTKEGKNKNRNIHTTATDGTVSIENLQELTSGFSTGTIWTFIYFHSCQIWD